MPVPPDEHRRAAQASTPEPGSVAGKLDPAGLGAAGEAMPVHRFERRLLAEVYLGRARSEVEGADQLLVAGVAAEDHDVVVGSPELDVALAQGGIGAAEGEEAPVMLEQRILVSPCWRSTASGRCSGGTGSHGFGGGEAAMRRACSHTIGVRQPSRPLNSGHMALP